MEISDGHSGEAEEESGGGNMCIAVMLIERWDEISSMIVNYVRFS